MSSARNKADLITSTREEWAKLQKLISGIPDDVALRKDADDISIKDVVGHRAHWISLFFGWFKDGQAGKQVYFPAEGFKWSDIKAYNALIRAQQAGMSWEETRESLARAHAELMAFLESTSDFVLYSGPMRGAKNEWPVGRWAESAGPSHYRSATKYIRRRLKKS